ncbi:PREDICTED: uncharacterized protein LOC108561699 [Nicrophorus vespilloides]|uniref:Uncharacterized protein LOC108561699 n=1 Tax=Nicrophorus vespilloides TaxID=110193 RepID=A0ABM1ML45_NICVS|nr:PREDICTED: uncharacterized protein LOC108561699 [Nicrophorus vespilloides]
MLNTYKGCRHTNLITFNSKIHTHIIPYLFIYIEIMKVLLLFLICFVASVKMDVEVTSNVDCLLDKDCKENSFCFDRNINKKGKCKCNRDFFLINPRNYKCVQAASTLRIPGTCEQSEQCTKRFVNSECKNKQCVCLTDFHDSGNRCIQSKHLGDDCISDDECVDATICTNGKCGKKDANKIDDQRNINIFLLLISSTDIELLRKTFKI